MNTPIESWESVLGHTTIRPAFVNAIRQGRLGGSLLFVGPNGVGKNSIALLLAQTLFCRVHLPSEMSPCGRCEDCTQVRAQTHSDLIQVRKPSDRNFIPLDTLIGPPEARLQEGFCHDVHLRPMQAARKVAILHDADFLNEEGANCLLKTLEEPPANALIILIGTSEQKQLPTIRSRCQTIRFTSPTDVPGRELLRRHLAISEFVEDGQTFEDAVLDDAMELAAGDMHAAARIVSGQGREVREKLLQQLRSDVPDPVIVARCLNDCLNAAHAKDARIRRAAFRDACAFVIQHYRGQLRRNAENGLYDDQVHQRLDRTVRVYHEIDRNANLGTLVDCYASDLTLATSESRGAIG